VGKKWRKACVAWEEDEKAIGNGGERLVGKQRV